MDEAIKFTFFSSYYEAAKLLPESEQGDFLMGLLRYAFDGEEPSFSGAAQIAFVLVKPNIDSSLKRTKTNTENARKATAKASSEDEKATAKATAQASEKDAKATAKATSSLDKDKDKEKDKDRDMDKDRERNFSKEKNFSPLASSGGAAAAKAAPPRCPLCESTLFRNTQTGKWDCPGCCETYPSDRFAA